MHRSIVDYGMSGGGGGFDGGTAGRYDEYEKMEIHLTIVLNLRRSVPLSTKR